jgi:hypothetical protein
MDKYDKISVEHVISTCGIITFNKESKIKRDIPVRLEISREDLIKSMRVRFNRLNNLEYKIKDAINRSVEHKAIELEDDVDGIESATVKSTNLGFEDHGIFCININFEYEGGCCQGTGAYAISNLFVEKAIKSYLKFFEVDFWEKIPGKKCNVKIIKGLIKEFQNIRTGEWFKMEDIFSEDEPMKAWRLLNEIDKRPIKR